MMPRRRGLRALLGAVLLGAAIACGARGAWADDVPRRVRRHGSAADGGQPAATGNAAGGDAAAGNAATGNAAGSAGAAGGKDAAGNAAARGAAAPRAGALQFPAGTGAMVVTLVWDAPVDLDLYVTGARGESLLDGSHGAVREREARCGDDATGSRVEQVRFAAPVSGRYRVAVGYPQACDPAWAQREVPFRIVVEGRGDRREAVGKARPQARTPTVLELRVP